MSNKVAAEEELVPSDFVLLLLAAPGRGEATQDRINGITRLEKLLFLAEKESDAGREIGNAFHFEAYDYGPYSKGVYEAVEILEQAGIVSEERAFAGQPLDEMEEWTAGIDQREGIERRFILTDRGKVVAGYLAKLHPNVADALGRIKKQYGDLSLRKLIRYVYGTYPSFAEASKIRDQIL
jgi:hypothetical protein